METIRLVLMRAKQLRAVTWFDGIPTGPTHLLYLALSFGAHCCLAMYTTVELLYNGHHWNQQLCPLYSEVSLTQRFPVYFW